MAASYVVSDSKDVKVGQQTPILGTFTTEQEAAEFIGTLPEPETGRYSLDGPSDDFCVDCGLWPCRCDYLYDTWKERDLL